MRATDMLDLLDEATVLDAKKRLGSKQKVRRATIADQLSQVTHPAPRPRRAPTGERADFQGNVYAMHANAKPMSLRAMRRANRFGAPGTVQPMRSRIQRLRRKQRTGGVR